MGADSRLRVVDGRERAFDLGLAVRIGTDLADTCPHAGLLGELALDDRQGSGHLCHNCDRAVGQKTTQTRPFGQKTTRDVLYLALVLWTKMYEIGGWGERMCALGGSLPAPLADGANGGRCYASGGCAL